MYVCVCVCVWGGGGGGGGGGGVCSSIPDIQNETKQLYSVIYNMQGRIPSCNVSTVCMSAC